MRALIVFLVLAATFVVGYADEIRVIAHPKTPVARVDRKFVTDAFLKKRSRWNDELAIRPVDLGPTSPVRRRFSEGILGRTVQAVRRFWNQQVFSGRGVPPPQVDSEAAVVEYVLAHPGAIGYVSDAADLRGAKVILER